MSALLLENHKKYFNETWYTYKALLLAYLRSYFPLIIFHTILCPLYNKKKTIRYFSMNHGTLIKHDETMCHAQISLLLLSYLTVRDISMKLGTLITENDRICDAQEL